jgi:hypothetical protein
MKQIVKSIRDYLFRVTTIVLLLSLISLTGKSQDAMSKFIVNDQVIPEATITQMEQQYGVKFIPGTYWYDKMTGAFGSKGGPCIGVGIAGLQIGGPLQSNASGGNTRIFINGRELHQADVQVLQTFMQPRLGRYWMDAYGNFGYENYPVAIGNVYQLYNLRFGNVNKGSSTHKQNPWSGQTTSFGSDGNGFMYFTSKQPGGEYIDYSIDR